MPLCFKSDEMNPHKIDVYFLVDKMRWPENVAYDIAELFSITILVYTIYSLIPQKEYKRYAGCFLITTLLSIPGYFLFYSQFVTLTFIPLLIILLLIARRKNVHEARNHTR